MNTHSLCMWICLLTLPIPLATCSASELDLGKRFGKYAGTIVVYDQTSDRYFFHNRQRAAARYSPYSTFKILNSIVALEAGIVTDVDSVYQWDTARYAPQSWWPPQWNARHTMRTAMKFSVVPFYRTLALRIGLERMQSQVKAFQYGNMDISSGVDDFWLNGSLKISAIEQVDFLKRFYNGRLDIGDHARESVKAILVQEKGEDYVVSAKTGAATLDSGSVRARGWYVGYVEKGPNVFFFALNLDGESFADILQPRVDITMNILRDLRIID